MESGDIAGLAFAYNNAHDAVPPSVFLATAPLFSAFGRRERKGGSPLEQGAHSKVAAIRHERKTYTRAKREREIQWQVSAALEGGQKSGRQ